MAKMVLNSIMKWIDNKNNLPCRGGVSKIIDRVCKKTDRVCKIIDRVCKTKSTINPSVCIHYKNRKK